MKTFECCSFIGWHRTLSLYVMLNPATILWTMNGLLFLWTIDDYISPNFFEEMFWNSFSLTANSRGTFIRCFLAISIPGKNHNLLINCLVRIKVWLKQINYPKVHMEYTQKYFQLATGIERSRQTHSRTILILTSTPVQNVPPCSWGDKLLRLSQSLLPVEYDVHSIHRP